jgi:hypothetical protein
MRIVVFANCGRWAIRRMLTEMHPSFHVVDATNYEGRYENVLGLIHSMRPDWIVWQAHDVRAYAEKQGKPGFADEWEKVLERYSHVSYVHPHNDALWPFFSRSQRNNYHNELKMQAPTLEHAQRMWGTDQLRFDFGARFARTLDHHIQQEKKLKPPILLAQWLVDNHQRCRLFYAQNHPAPATFSELGRRIAEITGWEHRPDVLSKLPGSWVTADNALPHSRYDYAYYQFAYCSPDLVKANDYYWLTMLHEVY